MTYTPAQISAAHGGDVFSLDYAHADVAQTFTYGAGSWGLYTANNVAVGQSITPAYANTGISIAGTVTFSVTTQHLDTFACSHVHWDGTGVTVQYTLNGTTWTALPQDGVVPMSGTADLDIRVSFAGGQAKDPAVLNSLTVYVLTAGNMTSVNHRTLHFGSDAITSAGLVTVGGETIAAADPASGVTTGSIEIYAALGALGPVVNGGAFAFSVDSTGHPVVAGCTVYINGVLSTSAPTLITGVIPYHLIIVPNTAVNEQLTLGAGLTVSNLALYAQALTASDASNIYSAIHNGAPSLVINDTAAIGITEGWTRQNADSTTTVMPATDIYAYAWAIVSTTAR